MPLSTKGDLPIRRRSTSRFVSTLMAAFGWLAATAVRPRPDLVVELPKESRWARWGPTIVEGLVLAGLLLGLERARIDVGVRGHWHQRSRWSISFGTMMNKTARQNWPSRCPDRRSVLRRSCPKLESHEFVRSTGQRRPMV